MAMTEMDRAKRAMQWVAHQVGSACGASVEELTLGEEVARVALDEARRQESVADIATYGAMVDAFVAYRAFMESVVPLRERFRAGAGQ